MSQRRGLPFLALLVARELTSETMKTLETEFTSRGFTHRQVFREGNVAIYERTKPGWSRTHYEVIRIRTAKASHRFGKDFPATELYPAAEQWGRFGFTCADLTSAKQRAAVLIRSKS